MKISYAKNADVLYLTFRDAPAKTVYAETSPGIICRIDEAKNEVVGVTVTDFMRRLNAGEKISIPELDEGLSADSLLQLL